MKKVFLALAFFISLTFITSFIHPASADWLKLSDASIDCTYSPTGGVNAGVVVTFDCFPQLFANLVYWLILFSGTVALFFVIFGGIKLLTSGGDAKKVEDSRKTITWSLIGLVVVLMSFGIVAIVAQTTGISCITKVGFTACGASTTRLPEYKGCSAGNPYAVCPGNQVCGYDSDISGYTCMKSQCSSKSPNAPCPNGNVCQFDPSEGGSYACAKSQCSSTSPNAPCPNGLICQYDSQSSIYRCK